MPKFKGFDTYGHQEIKEAGNTFVRLFDKESRWPALARLSTTDWTEVTLDWFASKARPSAVVDARPARKARGRGDPIESWLRKLVGDQRETFGEFLFDMSHSSYPKYDSTYGSAAYWKTAFASRPEMLLVLESEAGRRTSAASTLALVMEDASKLLHVAARAKVVVFASTKLDNRDEIEKLATAMAAEDRTGTDKGAPTWLWIDLPWPAWSDKLRPWCKCFAGAGKAAP